MTEQPTARWCTQLAGTLLDVGWRVGRLSEQIAADWPDGHGREWAERSDLLHKELNRAALAAAELGRLLARETTEHGSEAIAPPSSIGGARGRAGIRLGETAGTRTDHERGMRIAELPDHGPLPG